MSEELNAALNILFVLKLEPCHPVRFTCMIHDAKVVWIPKYCFFGYDK